LLYLAREYRRPLYQHLALWDGWLGAIQKSRYITRHGEQMLFEFGGYDYAWYDSSVSAGTESELPLSFEFPEVHEIYLRSSYEQGGMVAGLAPGRIVVSAGGQTVFINQWDWQPPAGAGKPLALEENGTNATVRFADAVDKTTRQQTVELIRPGRLTLRWKTEQEIRWWCQGNPRREGNALVWPDGTRLKVLIGSIQSFSSNGYRANKITGLGKLDLTRYDPMPAKHPLVSAKPIKGEIGIEIQTPSQK
jgi:hypothetical protein